jgi:hypothetical protein
VKGIFNPPESAANVGVSRDFGELRVANGPTPELPPGTCPECGGAGDIVYGDGGEGGRATETGWSATCPVCWGEGRIWVPIPSLADGGLPRTTALALEAYWRAEFAS